MKKTISKPLVILILLIVVFILLATTICFSSLYSSKSIENFQSTTAATMQESEDLFKNTYDIADLQGDPDKLVKMFSSLDEAEKKCDILESQQFQRNQREHMRENDLTYKQLQEQDKQIHELKEIVKYLSIEKKRRDKIDKNCKSTKQRKLNEQYDIVQKLNDSGMVKENNIDLDLNISDSKKMKELINSLKSEKLNASQRSEATDSNSYVKCKDKGAGYVDIDKIGLEKCNRCDKDKLAAQENYIMKDF